MFGLPADIVGLAGVLKRQTVGFVLVLVGTDWDNGLPPALRTRSLVPRWTRAKQHAIAVFSGDLFS